MNNDRLTESEIYEAIRALLFKACDALTNFGFTAERIAAVRRLTEDILTEYKDDIPKTVFEDVAAFRERDPAATSDEEIVLLYAGFHALEIYRVAHILHIRKHTFEARALSQVAKFLTGVEIHPGATVGKGLVIDHGEAVVIGETAEIGDNCTLYQGVTLGGTGKDTGKRHPTLGNNVLVGSGAKVLGPFKVGDNAKIAAGAVVLKEIPPDCTAVGIPAKVVKNGDARIDTMELDQIHIPDPVAQELQRLATRIKELEAAIENK